MLDADGSGRSVPKLPMFTPYIYGGTDYSCCAADDKGNFKISTDATSAESLEDEIRKFCVEVG